MTTSKQQLELQLAILQNGIEQLNSHIDEEEKRRDRLNAAKAELARIEMKLALTTALLALRAARASNEMNALQISQAKKKIAEIIGKEMAA